MNNGFNFAQKRILILGLARQGMALARFFVSQGARVTVSDAASPEKLANEVAKLGDLPVRLALGGHPLSLLDDCDLLCLSGGVPPQLDFVQRAIARGIPLSNDSLLTFQLARQRQLGPIVAITGSSGKTTTTTLVGKMLQASGLTVHVGGNIGSPLIDRMESIQPGEPLVLELSSFQLELFDPAFALDLNLGTVSREGLVGVGPDVAAILNITPNHLDRHPSMAAYASAKFNLFRRLPHKATVVVSADDEVTQRLLEAGQSESSQSEGDPWGIESLIADVQAQLSHLQAHLVGFSRETTLATGAWVEDEQLMYKQKSFCKRDKVRLRGDHNISNMLAAAAISGAAGANPEAMGKVAHSFAGVPHRLEIVSESDGVTWINDSIATAPERAVAGLRSFPPDEQTLILLAGGKDKNLPWHLFATEVIQRVKFLIGFGHAGSMIVDTVRQQAAFLGCSGPESAVVQRLEEAVELARLAARPGTVVLLSPGGTSYDAYRDFEERGEHFRSLVNHL